VTPRRHTVNLHATPHLAKLLVEVPASRYRVLTQEGRTPRVGDAVALDQGYTCPDGLPMVLAYFPATLAEPCLYGIEVYESELDLPSQMHR
jgi:hypothetical protein